MIKRIYTWVDVDSVLRLSLESELWPEWLQSASCYVSELELEVISPATSETILGWLRETFGPKADEVGGGLVLSLDGGQGRSIAVSWDEVSSPVFQRPKLLFGPSGRLARLRVEGGISGQVFDGPPIYAFHSFKGGVGRTTAALALALEISKSSVGTSGAVLLIDADMEAPGISYLLEARVPDYPISFADLLALANEELANPDLNSVDIVAGALKGLEFDGMTVLPSFRGVDAYETNGVRPEHLIRNSTDPYILSTLLRRLGKAVGAKAVIIDLRAGISEISSGLLLDPTINRVLVTTLGGQSLAGTRSILSRVLRSGGLLSSALEPGKEVGVDVVISQVRDEQKKDVLVDAWSELLPGDPELHRVSTDVEDATNGEGEESSQSSFRFITVDYVGDLATMSRSWSECCDQIVRSRIGDSVRSIADVVLATDGHVAEHNLDSSRIKLEKFSREMEYAESAGGGGYLVTGSLERISSDYIGEVPLLAVVGQKGAGKSYTFLQIVKSRDWGAFAGNVSGKSIEMKAPVFPLLAPFNLRDNASVLIENARSDFSTRLGFGHAAREELIDKIRAGLGIDLNQSAWRDLWLTAFSSAIGIPADGDPTKAILDAMKSAGLSKAVFVMDGLEDLFQNIHSNEREQCALRALLQDVLPWISQISTRPVGLMIFVRRDMVLAAVRQNPGQFLHRFMPYELRWDRTEALRLVGWLAKQSEVMEDYSEKEASEAKLAEYLVPLWGLKLGSADSREAHAAEWVLAALSDFRGQVQARDVVRFVRAAADESIGDTYWNDRLLVPSAIKKAPVTCGTEKIAEIEQETPRLREVFQKLRSLAPEQRRIPLSPVESGLSFEEMQMLELNGIVLREPDGYYMPEMYRQGLNFALAKGARPRVLALARRVTNSI